MSPREVRHCRAGASLEHCQVRLSVVRTGTTTVRMGTVGRYLATWVRGRVQYGLNTDYWQGLGYGWS